MPTSDEAHLTTLLWRATSGVEDALTQEEIDDILGVAERSSTGSVPEQRTAPEAEAWTRIRTDAGDQRWLNHLSEPHCWEF